MYKRVNSKDDKLFNIVKVTLQNQKETIRCLNEILDFSSELFHHSINVALLSLLVGMETGISTKKMKELYIAGLLHDYGKLLIPKDILEKNGPLTERERKIIELHPGAGFLCLKRDTAFSDSILYAVLDHHEKADGSGYGNRKEGELISEFAKIISIVDVYDAMASDRAYRKAINFNTVKDYLCMSAGRSFDYKLAMHFIEIIDSNALVDLERKHENIIKQIISLNEALTCIV